MTQTELLRDKFGNKYGWYSKNYNETRDKFGNKIGSGNLLVSLLPRQ